MTTRKKESALGKGSGRTYKSQISPMKRKK